MSIKIRSSDLDVSKGKVEKISRHLSYPRGDNQPQNTASIIQRDGEKKTSFKKSISIKILSIIFIQTDKCLRFKRMISGKKFSWVCMWMQIYCIVSFMSDWLSIWTMRWMKIKSEQLIEWSFLCIRLIGNPDSDEFWCTKVNLLSLLLLLFFSKRSFVLFFSWHLRYVKNSSGHIFGCFRTYGMLVIFFS